MPVPLRNALFRVIAALFLVAGGLAGCRCGPAPPAERPVNQPSLRLVLLSSVAGALEPCGCVKDMLGGVDHAAAYLRAQGETPSLVLGAGPMLFMDPRLPEDRAAQDRWKAEALIQSFRDLGLRAWAPGMNDFALAPRELFALAGKDPVLLAGNLRVDATPLARTALYTVGNVRVGVAGVSRPALAGDPPPGVHVGDPVEALRVAVRELSEQGAALRVALVSLPRGEALRVAELVPDFHVMLVGKPVDQGEANDPVIPPTTVGRTLVVQAPNHLQAFYTVDLFVRDGKFEFANADTASDERARLERRAAELTRRIATAEKLEGARKEDLDARRRDLAGLRAQINALRAPAAPPEGSYYKAALVEVREKHGSDPKVAARLSEYYRRVNEHNRVAFRDRKPPPVPEGKSGFVGAEQCATCHYDEHAFWSKTRHASAYEALAHQHKEFNLDCVSCHVTGYGEPGGSTVTFVEGLKGVQCEVCHGPGSRHIENPADAARITRTPPVTLCGPKCHHVPHVKPDWDVHAAWKHIIGPGHGG